MICAQGGEAGGHSGDIPFSILVPSVVDLCRTAISAFTGQPVLVVAAGGIADGRGLAASLMYVCPRSSRLHLTSPQVRGIWRVGMHNLVNCLLGQ